MSDLEEELTELSAQWMSLIGGDHHKDRDCHFYITRTWSYGQEPKWVAEHYGYMYEFPKLESTSYDRCVEHLIMHLKEAIEEWNGQKEDAEHS